MASSWSALQVELLETGANSGTWGTLTNVNLGDAVLGEAITGSATVDFAADADVTITLTNSATTQAARNLRLNITESGAGVGCVRNLILGSNCQIEKFYLINNTGTGAKTVKNTSGTGISVPAGKATLVYNNGTNVVDAASYFTSLTLGSALPVASGGTGLTLGTSGGVLAYTASGTLASSSALAANALVIGGGAGAAPSTTTTGTGVLTFLGTPSSANLASAVTDETGSGSLVFATSPTLVTPNLGVPSFVTLTSATGLPLSTGVTGTLPIANGGTGTTSTTFVNAATNVTGTLPVANGGTGITSFGSGVATFLGTPSSANLASAVTDETGSGALVFATSPTLVTPVLGTPSSGTLSSCTVDGTDKVGFLNVPINSQSTAYTTVLADSGKVIFHPSTDANTRTFTIDSNANVPYPLGTAITFINMTSQAVTIAITTDTMYLSSAGTTGPRTLAQYGSATCIKMTSTTWLISGSGLT